MPDKKIKKDKKKVNLPKIFGINPKTIKMSAKEKINFLEQFSSLLQSGIPLINSLKIIMYQTKSKKIKIFLDTIIKELNQGNNLKDTFAKFPRIFGYFELAIIEMGEVTGKIGDSIETIRDKEEKSKELRGKVIGALVYPMVVVTLSVAMIGVFMVYVIPKIQKMYKDSKVNLPELTANVIKISEFIQENIVLIIAGIIIFISLVITFKSWKKTKIYWDAFIIRIPIFGVLIKKKILSMFTSSFGILLSNGVIINEALDISSRALENDYYEKKLKEISSRVQKGVELSELMGVNEIKSGKENFLFPIELSSAVKIGEETGNLANLLLRRADKMSKEIDDTVKNIQTAIEPIVIIGVGGIVGTLILAIMMPFFNMVKVI